MDFWRGSLEESQLGHPCALPSPVGVPRFLRDPSVPRSTHALPNSPEFWGQFLHPPSAFQEETAEFQGNVNAGSHLVSLLSVSGDKRCEKQMV